MTQAELARALGVSQQAVFAYDLGDLMRLTKPARVPKRRLSPRATRHAARLQALSKTTQRFVIRIIDLLEEHSTPSPVATVGN